MFKNLSIFQIVLIGAFGLSAVIGLIVFATGFGVEGGSRDTLPPITIWGTLDEDVVEEVVRGLQDRDDRFSNITYVEKDARTYNEEFVDALAAGRGPDLVLFTEQDIVRHRDKLITIPFDAYSERTYKSAFVEVGELFFAHEGGFFALPFAVDPMVMYWNRDRLGDEGIVNPPAFWDEFFTLSPKITKRDRSANIVESFVAFGEFRNVTHAKDILSALILQTGNAIVGYNERGELVSILGENFNFVEPPTVSALRFYTEFSNPVKSVYSWNRALPESRQAFVAGDLAVYMGFASELSSLRNANPNLNFDVAMFPRSRDAARTITLARVYGLAIPRGSSDTNAAFTVASALTGVEEIKQLAELSGLPPVRRDLLEDKPSDAVGPVFYDSAIAARGWLDPNPAITDDIYQRMIESTLSGRALLNEAVQSADQELNSLLR